MAMVLALQQVLTVFGEQGYARGLQSGHSGYEALQRDWDEMLNQRNQARAELADVLDGAVRQCGYLVKDGDMAGWWDSQALSFVVECGDRLVELGLWERHPHGCGRRWFYRPIEQTKQESEGAETPAGEYPAQPGS